MKKFSSCRSGTAAIEFAIVGFALVLVCLAVVEFGRGLYLRNELSFAADVAARKALTKPAISNADLEEALRSALTGVDSALMKISLGTETAEGIQFRTVALSYPFSPLVPGVADDLITLSLSRRIPLGN